ncbi:MAG: hypothetical protein M5U12_13295 [Verrucomicrobia bacterium]|nr:hypothetical protein [Verrucomicrobiota bacterium]
MGQKIRGLYQRGRIFWFAHQENGRRVYVSLKTPDYVLAVQRAAQIIKRPSLNPTEGLAADIDAFLTYQLAHHNFTAATADSKGAILRKFGDWIGWLDTASITAEDLQRFYDEQRQTIKEGSAQTYVMALRSFFGWAVQQALRRDNPAAEVRMGRVVSTPRRRFCTFAERDRIIAEAPTGELSFVLYCGFHAGLRKNEIIQARPDWFDLDQGLLHVRKTPTFEPKDKEERTVPLTKEFREFPRRVRQARPVHAPARRRAGQIALPLRLRPPLLPLPRTAGLPLGDAPHHAPHLRQPPGQPRLLDLQDRHLDGRRGRHDPEALRQTAAD